MKDSFHFGIETERSAIRQSDLYKLLLISVSATDGAFVVVVVALASNDETKIRLFRENKMTTIPQHTMP